MAAYEIHKEKGSERIEASGAEATKLDNYTYNTPLKYTDDSGRVHNLNPDKIQEIVKLP